MSTVSEPLAVDRLADASLALAGAFDIAGVDTFTAACAESTGDDTLRLDSLVFIDACGLSAIVTAAQPLSALGHRLTITGAPARTRRIFELGDLTHLLDER